MYLNFNANGNYSISQESTFKKVNTVYEFINSIKNCDSVTLLINNPKFIIDELNDIQFLERNCFLSKEELNSVSDEIKHVLDVYLK